MYQHIKRIEKLFELSREAFDKLKLSTKKFELDSNRKLCFDRGMKLIEVFSSFERSKLWFDEMKSNSSSEDYLELTEYIFAVQYKFILKFQKAMSIYLYDNELDNAYHKRLHGIDKRALKERDEIVLGIQLFFITIFKIYENKVDEYLLRYNSLLVLPDVDSTKVVKSNFIQLDYGDKNEKVIDTLFKSLQGKHIKMSMPDFRMHFTDIVCTEPIEFLGSQANLINLFFGVGNLQLKGIRTKNADKLKMLVDHFQINGRKLDLIALRAQEAKTTTHPRGFGVIKQLLEEIMVINK